MPIYEYLCARCEREFEVEQRITDEPIRSCPHCRSRKVRRLISQTSFVLKGGGWYSDLYSSSKSKSEPAAAESKPSSDASSGASDAKESKASPTPPKDTKGPDSGGKGKGKGKKSEAKAAA
jgi:putative FmdB family regulatory protein